MKTFDPSGTYKAQTSTSDHGASPFLPLSSSPPLRLILLGIGCWLCYLAVACSARSLHEAGSGNPTLLVLLALFGVAFGLHLVALRVAIRLPDGRKLLAVLWAGAVLFRVTLLLCDPIEEIDLYRYVWDGAVSQSGVSPFRYSPQQVLASKADDELPDDLARLVRLRDRSPELAAILRRIHFGELPTIYPPVSQLVFAACSWLTPEGSSVATRLTLMKAWFVAFDLVTLALVLRLLSQASRHRGWAIAYGWCPLVIKEIANSGHLDALATCLMTLAISLLLSALATSSDQPARQVRLSMGAALALALGVGAKLFPVVLAPLLLWTLAKRVSVRTSLLAAVVFVTASLTVLRPMLPTFETSDGSSLELNNAHVTQSDNDQPPLPPIEVSTSPRDPSESLRTFLGRWEMNDFLFLIVIENLRPSTGLPPEQVAWFTVTPESWRQGLVANVVSATGVASERVPFLLTRLLLGGVFVALSCGFIGWATARGSRRPSSNETLPRETIETSALASRVLEVAFLTLVWFWLLLPTQNPWYLTWALPLIPFARRRVWFALSGLAFVYYLRFWMTARLTEPLWGTPYSGSQFFDVIITWVEFAPWLIWLTWSSCGGREYSSPTSPPRRPNDDFASGGISAQSNVPH